MNCTTLKKEAFDNGEGFKSYRNYDSWSIREVEFIISIIMKKSEIGRVCISFYYRELNSSPIRRILGRVVWTIFYILGSKIVPENSEL